MSKPISMSEDRIQRSLQTLNSHDASPVKPVELVRKSAARVALSRQKIERSDQLIEQRKSLMPCDRPK